MNSNTICRYGRLLALGVILFPTSYSIAADQDATKDVQDDSTAIVELNSLKSDFEYTTEGRPDPFKPFLSPKIELDPNEIIDTKQALTGMQLFEPGQLTLVAIMQVGQEHIAMVQDSTGKGYVLNTGMKIGRRGEIINIEADRVIIEETAITRAKKEIKSRIDMVLNNEGEK